MLQILDASLGTEIFPSFVWARKPVSYVPRKKQSLPPKMETDYNETM